MLTQLLIFSTKQPIRSTEHLNDLNSILTFLQKHLNSSGLDYRPHFISPKTIPVLKFITCIKVNDLSPFGTYAIPKWSLIYQAISVSILTTSSRHHYVYVSTLLLWNYGNRKLLSILCSATLIKVKVSSNHRLNVICLATAMSQSHMKCNCFGCSD